MRMGNRWVVAWIVALGLGATPLVAEDWPRFLGADGNGISAETGLIEAFPDEGPRVLWRVPGGVGMSGVAVSQGLAVTLVQRQERQWIVALDAKTGQEKWASDLAPA